MHPTAKSALRAATIVAIGSGLIALYFADNIQGYYRFKELCRTEGGLRVLHPLRKDVGWSGERNAGGLVAASFKEVPFIRIEDENKIPHDYKYRGGRFEQEDSYDKFLSDKSIQPVYKITFVNEELTNEKRMNRSGYEIREIGSNRLMVRWYQLGYSTFNRERTLFAAPSGQACHLWDGFFSSEIRNNLFK